MHDITAPTADTTDFPLPRLGLTHQKYAFGKWHPPPGRELFVTKFDNLIALKAMKQNLKHNRTHASAVTRIMPLDR